MMILFTVQVALIGILVYTWVGYPLILRLVAERKRRRDGPERYLSLPPFEPSRISVLIAAHNEELHVGMRLQNLLECIEYLRDSGLDVRVDVYLGCDACADRTVAIANEIAEKHTNIHVLDFRERRGKAAILKDLVTASAGEGKDSRESAQGSQEAERRVGEDRDILVFTDANTVFHTGAMARLLQPFADERIGGVCGRLILTEGLAGASNPPEQSYWDWENRVKAWESTLDSFLGANGAIYAVRRCLFWRDLPANTIIDDFVLGMQVREQKARMVFEPEAVAEEELPGSSHEWRRRVRIGSGAYQALSLCRSALSLRFAAWSWSFWSHKVFRWMTPHIMLLALLVALWLPLACFYSGGICDCLYAVSLELGLAATAVLLSIAVAGCRKRGGSRCVWVNGLTHIRHFLIMQGALLAASARVGRHGRVGYWDRTLRRVTRH